MFYVPLKFLGEGYAAYRHVRALIFVSPEPLCGRCLGLIDAHKHMLVQPGISDRSVIALHISILLRVAWLDKHQADAVLFRQSRQSVADIFRAIITTAWFVRAPVIENTIPVDSFVISCAVAVLTLLSGLCIYKNRRADIGMWMQ